jgi:2-hydroxy-3-keto-5-methylthiopentenyl-1-phosphate phosphatase
VFLFLLENELSFKRREKNQATSSIFQKIRFSVDMFCNCRISPGIAELIMKLKEKSTDVYLVSGGFRQMIQVH